jgi:hypothetical protein
MQYAHQRKEEKEKENSEPLGDVQTLHGDLHSKHQRLAPYTKRALQQKRRLKTSRSGTLAINGASCTMGCDNHTTFVILTHEFEKIVWEWKIRMPAQIA